MAGGVHEIAVLYDAMRRTEGNPGPREVDEMELWECAVAMGVIAPEPSGASANESRRKGRSVELIRRRMEAEAARQRGEDVPEVEVQPVDGERLAGMASMGRGDVL